MVRAGQLRHWVEIRRPISNQGPGGSPDAEGDFTLIDETWAEINEESGQREDEARTEISTVEATIRLRHREDVQPGWRIVHADENAIYQVQAVLNDPTREDHLVCRAERMFGRG